MKKLYNSQINTAKLRYFLTIFFVLFCLSSYSFAQKSFNIKDYCPISNGNEWRYTAPPNWKDGDYISKIVLDKNNFASTFSIDPRWDAPTVGDYSLNTFKHYDATKAAKLLRIENGNVYYIGEEFAGRESFVTFNKPILWFPKKVKIGQKLNEERNFTRYFKDGKTLVGRFKITQEIVKFETVRVTAGKFKKTLRIESETFWDMGDGTKAQTKNVYHYAKNVGVVKASARFIIFDKDGKEIINRLVETDLKSYKVN